MTISSYIYIPDSGSVTLNAAEVNGSVKTVEVSPPRKTSRKVNSLGGSTTVAQTRAKAGDYEVTLQIFDDNSLDFTAGASELLATLYDSYENDTAISDMSVIPAGSTIGMTEWTFSDIKVVQCPPFGQMDADTEEEATVQVILTVGSFASAAAT